MASEAEEKAKEKVKIMDKIPTFTPVEHPFTHVLKCWTPYFDAMLAGKKRFEKRIWDRDYQVGDSILQREWNPDTLYTGRSFVVDIKYILEGEFADPGICLMSVTDPNDGIIKAGDVVWAEGDWSIARHEWPKGVVDFGVYEDNENLCLCETREIAKRIIDALRGIEVFAELVKQAREGARKKEEGLGPDYCREHPKQVDSCHHALLRNVAKIWEDLYGERNPFKEG